MEQDFNKPEIFESNEELRKIEEDTLRKRHRLVDLVDGAREHLIIANSREFGRFEDIREALTEYLLGVDKLTSLLKQTKQS